jgi:hypothetical protein
MYCPQCGKEMPDDANFCLNCGRSLKSAMPVPPQAAPRWEYCEIVSIVGGLMGGKSYFAAQAVGSKGRYEAARSTKHFQAVPTEHGIALDTYTMGGKRLTEAALDEVMSALSADGWELTGEKGEWWEYKYRRREHS